MARPTVLVVEPEPEQALSTRKLVLETAKFNVLTAHSGREFIELVHRFPKVDCTIIHGQIDDIPCEALLAEAKKTNPKVTTVFLAARLGERCKGADHVISSHHPEAVLDLLRKLFGDPRDPSPDPHHAR